MNLKLNTLGSLRRGFANRGKLEKIAKYFHVIYSDYKAVFNELLGDMRKRPIKSGIYISVLATAAWLFKTNPSEQDFKALMKESANDLAMVGDLVRNQKADKYIKSLVHNYNDEKLHYVSLGLFSFVYLSDCRSSLELYCTQCKHVQPHWTQFHKTIIDVGLLGKWININRAMLDFDISDSEWETHDTK